MTRYIIPIAVLFMLASMASASVWLYTDPTFFSMGTQTNAAGLQVTLIGSQFSSGVGTFKPENLSPFEIINAPYFPLLSGGLNTASTQTQPQSTTPPVEIRSSGKLNSPPQQLTFSGGMEGNLKYAQTKSSLKVGQEGSWTNLNNPWLI